MSLRAQLQAEFQERFVVRKYAPGQARDPKGTSTGGQFSKATSKEAFLKEFDPKKKETWYRKSDGWHRSPEGERSYDTPDDPNYVPPPVTHKGIRGAYVGMWGNSHSGSSTITGESAEQMGIEGWEKYDATKEASDVATKMLTAIAEDETGSEEPLYHSFENTRGTIFKPGDTMKLPLMASAGKPQTTYATRSEWESQQGAPTVFVFPKGTPMVGYSKASKSDAKELGHATVEDVYKEFGYIWDEAIVAGKFRVMKVETVYMGSQHSNKPIAPGETPQLYGQVVHLEPLEKFDPKTGKWVPLG